MQEHGVNYLAPAPELIEGEPEWEVKRILASQYYGRHRAIPGPMGRVSGITQLLGTGGKCVSATACQAIL